MTEISDKAVEAAALSDATFDGRTFDVLGAADKRRYRDRARAALSAALPHLVAAGVAVPEVLTPLVAEILAARQSRAEALHDKIFSVREKLRAHLAPDCPTWLREAFNDLHAAHHILGGDPFDMHIRAALVPSPVPQEATAEPVAWQWHHGDGWTLTCVKPDRQLSKWQPLYASPPSHDAELLAALADDIIWRVSNVLDMRDPAIRGPIERQIRGAIADWQTPPAALAQSAAPVQQAAPSGEGE